MQNNKSNGNKMKTGILTFIQLLPVLFSMLLLAAHFLRADIIPLVILSLLMPIGLFIRKAVIARIFQIILILGSIEWIRTTFLLVAIREQQGQPWTKLVVILASVAFFTFASLFVFFLKNLKKRYGLNKSR
ncbi:MAG: hypothetical protein GXP60_00845 [Epsilonproteobacteria bacterium]|nr:hypothetical protein [Campylobacterota bacterium]